MLFDLKAKIPVLRTSREYPYWNEPSSVVSDVVTKPKSYDDLDWWIERTPEMLSIINAITTDITADGFTFLGKKSDVKKAMKFVKLNRFHENIKNTIFDMLTYGDGYMWLGIPADDDVKNLYKKLTGSDPNFKINLDEDFLKMIKYVPSTTLNIIHDGKVITKFKQSIAGRDSINFAPEQIIHVKYMTVVGKIYGYSPAISLLSEMSTLSYIKDYAGNFFKNGGVPDWMFTFPNEMPNSPNVQILEQKLKKYQSPQLKHGNLIFTGDIKAEKIGEGLNRDMEFRQTAIYMTAVMGLGYGMPMSRIASIIGAEVKVSSGSDDLANEGYWSQISNHQTNIEMLWNTQLWEKYFDVRMKFNKAWKTNEIKEQQRNGFAIANITNIQKELERYKLQVSEEYIKKTMYLKDEDVEKLDEEFIEKRQEMMQPQQAPGQKQLDNKQIERGGATEKMREDKKNQVKTDQKLTMKSKLIHDVSPLVFAEKFQMWVKQSETRDCYYFIKNGVLTATMSMPDESFKMVTSIENIDPFFLQELKDNGEMTEGVE